MIKSICAALLLVTTPLVWGHGGVSNDGNECKLSVGPYLMGFSGYQPENNLSEQFCDDMPNTGKSIIVLDFIDRKLLGMTVSFKVINADRAALGTADDAMVNEAELAAKAFFEIPAKIYPSGTMKISQEFKEKGHFVGYVVVEGDNEKHISRFPFSVGYEQGFIPDAMQLPLIIIVSFGFLMYWFSRKEPVKNRDTKVEE